ncbi:hypothetical protein [Streptomyces sp. TRM70350]|uniref:hypothetical protein n=1 Tax=Streptomyces sp. TRM70350 TaxID=2856165 RepID=UPI001C455677|nr:hypothetical protein [Streptomyces sp. TRM70350]MBV7695726.1 hypothetical protein [Streptomyces sp. TRM70350]
MGHEGKAEDPAQEIRHLRFGRLPERIRPEDMIEERPAVAHDPAREAYNADEWLVRVCL